MCPFDRRTLQPNLLNAEERAWLDDYHACVRAALSPLLEGVDRTGWSAIVRPCPPEGRRATCLRE